MARSKQTSRRGKSIPVDHIGINDPLPPYAIDCILALPKQEDGEPSSEEHASKRRKVHAGHASFCIAASIVYFSRQCGDQEPRTYHEKRNDIEGSLNLALQDLPISGSALRDQRLRISTRTTRGANPMRLELSLTPEEFGPDVGNILKLSEGQENDTPGSIWSRADVSLEREGTTLAVEIELRLYWNATPSPLNGFRTSDYRKRTQALIDTFYPSSSTAASASSPMDFYEAASVPDKNDQQSTQITVPDMDATLFPYQKRTVSWLLKREGARWTETGGVEPCNESASTPVSDSARLVRDVDGKKMYLNDIFNTVAVDNDPYCSIEKSVKGGILAEEMGLGKTLEILALIMLHRRPRLDSTNTDTAADSLKNCGTTLIVTPESLRRQWISEISRHAPGLRFEFYAGCRRQDGEGDEVANNLAQCDVVVTTYSVLSSELHFTKDAPERSRRQERKYERPKSPLTQITWWRLCLDEAQMIENGISQAAMVARTIPRVNAWGITGTPVKDDVKDLYGLLSFLRYEPLFSSPQTWQAMIRGHKSVFQAVFNAIALRHTKALVRDEIALPPQHRYAISVPFTPVEEQHYQALFQEMATACEVDLQGNPIVEDWTPEDAEENMRVWLNRLRQTALHPEVGVYSRRILGQNRARPMRTVDEVLDAMIDQSDSAIRVDQRALLANKLTRGQIFENSPRVKEALAIWEDVKRESDKMVEEARAELKAAASDPNVNEAQAQDSEEVTDSEEEGDETEGSKGKVGEIRRKLRSALETQHKAVFFCANAFFQIRDNTEITEPDSEEFNRLKKLEDEGYDAAKAIRREILRENHRKVTKLMKKLSRKASGQSFTELSELNVHSDRGIESGPIIDKLELLYGELNQQANVIDEWREHSVQLLLKSLLDEEDDVEMTGEEMGDAAKMQDEMVVFNQILRSAIADRQDAMTGQTNELVNYEAKTSIRMAKDGDGPMPEKTLELFDIRAKIKPQIAHASMRGIISELRHLIQKLRNESNQTDRVRVEQAIATKHLQQTQAALQEQIKAASALEAEIESFRTTMNARLEYYRQLQSVSDSVLPYEGPKTEEALAKMSKAENDLQNKLSLAESKHRYLLHLKEGGSSKEPRMCVICQMSFEIGVLTVCGHQFCKDCMKEWYRAHRNCPVCKRHLTPNQLHDITLRPQELKIHGDDTDSKSQSPGAAQNGLDEKSGIYSTFNADKLAEIKNIELDGPSYTTKVDTIVRHLLWLRQTDPGAKSIVFSQYKDFLDVLATAFKRFRIGFASIDTHGGTTRFKEDPAVEVFLLHARAHSSGLNLVNANNVFLCEPLVNTALELQAIARVDRIGQQHETTVWLYVTSGTVEESIYNLSVKRRMEHMGRREDRTEPELLDANLEAANTLEMEQASLTKLMSKDKTAGEVVAKGDLWECLFGHVQNQSTGRVVDVDTTEADC